MFYMILGLHILMKVQTGPDDLGEMAPNVDESWTEGQRHLSGTSGQQGEVSKQKKPANHLQHTSPLTGANSLSAGVRGAFRRRTTTTAADPEPRSSFFSQTRKRASSVGGR